MSVCCGRCVLAGTGLCDELITRPEESYLLWCVVVCDLETSRMRTRRPRPTEGFRAKNKQTQKHSLASPFTHRFASRQAAKGSPIFKSDVSWGHRVDVIFLPTTYEEGAGNIHLRLADTCHVEETSCSFHVEI